MEQRKGRGLEEREEQGEGGSDKSHDDWSMELKDMRTQQKQY